MYGRGRDKNNRAHEAVRDAVYQVTTHVGALGSSQRWNEVVRPALLGQLKPPVEEIVCYALGLPQDSGVLWQIALLLLMAEALAIPSEKRLVFDPRHGHLERTILAACGLTILEKNEDARRTVKCRTLFYMPFGPYALTDHVVRANWYKLGQIAIVGNDLRWCVDHEWKYHGKPRPSLGRAPWAEDALAAYANATVLFEGDMTTRLSRSSLIEKEAERAFSERHCLNATLTTFSSKAPMRCSLWPRVAESVIIATSYITTLI